MKNVVFLCLSVLMGTLLPSCSYVSDTDILESGMKTNVCVNCEDSTRSDSRCASFCDGDWVSGRSDLDHALCKVGFEVSMSNCNLMVELRSVAVCNVFTSGSYVSSDDGCTGDWCELSDLAAVRLELSSSLLLDSDSGVVNLCSLSDSVEDDGIRMIPQSRNPFSQYDLEGAYLKVDCSIYAKTASSPVLLHEGSTYIPITVNWKPGESYIIHLDLGKDAGYSNLDDFTPTLSEIKVTVSVEDYIDVNSVVSLQ